MLEPEHSNTRTPEHAQPDRTIRHLAQMIWDYHHLDHRLEKADCILALGSHDTRVAERAASLYLEGWAPLLLFSGGLGNLTQGIWDEPEAEKFAAIARRMGVPDEHILIENRSTNTGENIRFSYRLLQERGIDVQRLILVQKPYMERRTYATFAKQWPGDPPQIRVTSQQVSLENYVNEEISLEQVIHIMVGDLQRIKIYPEKGFQIHQDIPAEVWEAFEQLVAAGYTRHLAPIVSS